MHAIHFWLNDERRYLIKGILLLLVSYFFVGISEGAFLFFESGVNTSINFAFTLFCVATNWLLFKGLNGRIFVNQHLVLRVLTMVLLLSAYTILINWVYIEVFWQERLANTVFFPVVLPLAVLLFAVWAVGYSWYREVLSGVRPRASVTFELKKGRQTLFRSLDQTQGFVVENKLVFLLTTTGERLLIERPLAELTTELEEMDFFRVNRQLLLSKRAISGFKTVANERLEVSLDPTLGIGTSCFVSRYKAPAFRKWLNKHHH